MSFGKRRTPPKATAPALPVAAPVEGLAASPAPERYAAWSERMLGILGQISLIAAAIREDGIIEVRGMDTETHPDTTPVNVKGVDEHFMFLDAGKIVHPVYGYVQPTVPGHVDQSAQLHIHQLVARVMELNLYCQRAVRDDALAVALQSPKLPPLVDRILVGSAFLAGYFENMAITQPLLMTGEKPGSIDFDWARLAGNMERRRLMAVDRMLVPATADELTPWRKWPFLGVETATKPHAGQKFHQGIYFPVGMAPAPIGPGIRATSAVAA